MPKNGQERILIVERDPLIGDLVANQALTTAGYEVELVTETTMAIKKALEMRPDAIIVNLDMPGLSGKDLMIALTAQRVDTPIVVLAKKGMEADVIQAYRLGAADYLLWPMREAEVIATMDRVLKQGRERKEKESLSLQYQKLTAEMQDRVREMNSLISIGKAVTSITDQRVLFERLLESITRMTRSDKSWFLVRNENTKDFHLVAFQNLPSSIESYLDQVWDDGISYLVANSGKALSIEGETLKKFKVSSFGNSILIVPVNIQREVIGLIVLMRNEKLAFSKNDLILAQAIADYASISLINLKLFQAVENRAKSFQYSARQLSLKENYSNSLFKQYKKEILETLDSLQKDVQTLKKQFDPETASLLDPIQQKLKRLEDVTQYFEPTGSEKNPESGKQTDLNEIVRKAVNKSQDFVKPYQISILMKLSKEPCFVRVKDEVMSGIFEGLLSNAIKFCNKGGRITVQIEKNADNQIHLEVHNTGKGIGSQQLEKIFSGAYKSEPEINGIFSGFGMDLPFMFQTIQYEKGKIWAETKINKLASFHVVLPSA